MNNNKKHYDIVLVGAGIMSATFAMMAHLLFPKKNIIVFEKLNDVALESSAAWNNAGTGHSAFCELNYTPQNTDGSINIDKAIKIAEQFEISKLFWTYLVENNIIEPSFIHPVPHHSLVMADNIHFLKQKVDLLKQNILFKDLQFSRQHTQLKEWFPLIMQNRQANTSMAASKMEQGTDVNFGALTKNIFNYLKNKSNCEIVTGHGVEDIDPHENNTWKIFIENELNHEKSEITASFVFVGAGGGSLKLLNKADIPEIDGYGGFPVGGKWLACVNENIINQHHAKVYGKAAIGAPPMSVPHLDTRIIDGKKELLFGPYAGFNTKFLKHGSWLDLPASLDLDNVLPMLQAGLDNIPLTQYLIEQVNMSFDEKLLALQYFYPDAQVQDWKLIEAGQRVQVIKKDEKGHGVLEFGTEIIFSSCGTISGILGASPGASTAVAIINKIFKNCFKNELQMASQTYNKIFVNNDGVMFKDETLLKQNRLKCASVLGLKI